MLFAVQSPIKRKHTHTHTLKIAKRHRYTQTHTRTHWNMLLIDKADNDSTIISEMDQSVNELSTSMFQFSIDSNPHRITQELTLIQ